MINFCISCAAGLESVLKKEIQLAGYTVNKNERKRIWFSGDIFAIAKINLRSRVGNKLYQELARAQITTFDQLFELISSVDRQAYIAHGYPIHIFATSKNSQLSSTPAIQSIAKKAMVTKLMGDKESKREENETYPAVQINIHIENNECTILLNTTGDSLHKRGRRKQAGDAPINESLAAGLILLSGWKFSEPFIDPCCGSGTFVIEAAMIAKNITPGILRDFAFLQFPSYDKALFQLEKEQAQQKVFREKKHIIKASDIDQKMIQLARNNAKIAGVEEYIDFSCKPVDSYLQNTMQGTLLSNPPYGRRLQSHDLENIYQTFSQLFKNNIGIHGGIITQYEAFDSYIDLAQRKKLPYFNGGEPCRFYKQK